MKRRHVIAAAAFVAVTAAAALAPVLDNGFIGVDDDHRIFENPVLARPLAGESVAWAFSAEAGRIYVQPVTWLAFQADAAAFGIDPRAFHAASLAAHLFAAVLLLLLLLRLGGALGPSLAAATLWAAHPLAVEPVAWAVERNALLATVLALLALHAYVAYARRPGAGRYVLVVGLFALSLLAKPWLFGLPVAMLALDAWPLRRWPPRGAADRARIAGRLILEKVPLLAVGAAWAVFAMHAMESGAAALAWTVAPRPLALRLAHAPVAIVRYLGKLVAPVALAIDHPFPDRVPAWQAAAALAVVLALTFVAVRLRHRAPALLTGWLWFLALIAPTLGVVQAGKWPAIAERFAYLPMAGLVAGALFAAAPLLAGRRASTRVAAGAVVLAAAAAVVASRAQARLWRDTVTVLSHSDAVAPGSGMVEYNLGSELGRRGRLGEAEDLLRRAVRHADTSEAHNQLANVLLLSGRGQEAADHYERAVAIDAERRGALQPRPGARGAGASERGTGAVRAVRPGRAPLAPGREAPGPGGARALSRPAPCVAGA